MTAATSTTANPRPTKTYQDGSAPFTMLEIEERLLRVFALPPAQINRAAVEKIFGVVLVGDEKQGNGGFAESISKDRQVEFTINVFRVSTRGLVFNYDVQVKTTRSDGLHIMDGHPDSIPAAYKIRYLAFVQKLQALGWKANGIHRHLGHSWNYFVKDGYRMELHIDTSQDDGQQVSRYSPFPTTSTSNTSSCPCASNQRLHPFTARFMRAFLLRINAVYTASNNHKMKLPSTNTILPCPYDTPFLCSAAAC